MYGRRTAQFKIEPFDYKDTGNMLPQYTNEEKAIIYGITGGIPLYVNFFTRHHQLKEALLEEVFKSSAYLFEEPSNLLKQELREAARYNAIIEAIANGHTRLNEIATKVNIETGLCSTYLNKLIELNIVKKEKPVDYKASKKTFYRICDPLFSFWFSFVANNLNLISTGMIEKYYEPLIADKLHSYMGRIFEDMCKTYLQKYEKQLPIIPSEIGQWWGANPIKKCECEFDIVILSHDKKDCILGECKFKDKMIDIGTAKELSENSEDIFTDLNKYYYLFSLSGFTEHLLKQQNERLRLVTLDDLYQ